MSYKYIKLTALFLLLSATTRAQDTLATSITYDLTAETAVGLEVGSREQPQVIRDNLLSVGSFVKGTNAKPVPQVHFGTNGFWDVPFTKRWVQINFDFGYGKFLDSGLSRGQVPNDAARCQRSVCYRHLLSPEAPVYPHESDETLLCDGGH